MNGIRSEKDYRFFPFIFGTRDGTKVSHRLSICSKHSLDVTFQHTVFTRLHSGGAGGCLANERLCGTHVQCLLLCRLAGS